jgi:hypothetical protein
VYAWIWHKLPGKGWAKLTESLVLLVAVGALLWYVVFPLATPLLPFDDVQVGTSQQDGPAAEDPDSVIPGDDGTVPYNTNSNNPAPSPSR